MRRISGKSIYGPMPESSRQRFMEALEKEMPPMKTKSTFALAMAVNLVIMLTATALAFGLFTPQPMDAIALAKQALMADYHLTADTLPYFHAASTQEEDDWIITFTPAAFDGERLGTYTVRIPKEGKAQTSWSHDGLNPALWQDGDLTAPAWGQPQLEKALSLPPEAIGVLPLETPTPAPQEMMEPAHSAMPADTREEGPQPIAGVMPLPTSSLFLVETPDSLQTYKTLTPGPEDLSPAQAAALAREAFETIYGFPILEERIQRETIAFGAPAHGEDAQYIITYTFMDHPWEQVTACIASPSGETIACWWRTPNSRRTLPDGPLDGYEQAIEAFLVSGALQAKDPAEQSRIIRQILDAGQGELLASLLPEIDVQDESRKAQAFDWAQEALLAAYPMPEEALALFLPTARLTDVDRAEKWLVTYAPIPSHTAFTSLFYEHVGKKLGTYTLLLDGATGVMDSIQWDLADVWDESLAFDESNWGKAPCLHASLLPYALALKAEVDAILRTYGDKSPYDVTWADHTRHDTLYREAGFPASDFPRAFPPPSSLSYEGAAAIVREAILGDHPFMEANLDAARIDGIYPAFPTEGPLWQFTVTFPLDDLLYTYQFDLDGITGEILTSQMNPLTGGNP